MPKPYPLEFRVDFVAVVRKGKTLLNPIAKGFRISQVFLHKLDEETDAEGGQRQGLTEADRKELREANRRIRPSEQGSEVLRRAALRVRVS